MKAKGFTLIELLAVVIILGVIALIVIPTVNNLVKQSKKESAIVSVYNYIEAVEKTLLSNKLSNDNTITQGGHDILELNSLIDVNGVKPTKGKVYIGTNNAVVAATLCLNNYKLDYADDSGVKVYDNTSCDDMAIYGFNEVKGVNKPVLAAGMTPVKWDASNNEITTTESDSSWYDYSSKKWANAKTKDGSYWVWIPRYAYKITSGYHSSTAGTISIKFLEGTTNVTSDNTKIENSGYVAGVNDTSANYFLHPSFDFDGDILGYWVAKYEPTAVEGIANGYTSDGSCPNVGDNVTTKTVKIIPNATSWRCMDIKTAYNISLGMKINPIYGWDASKVDTHMMKNTEWGAVSYLTQSTYGANNEVWINNANNFTTGCAANSVNQAASTTGCLNAYNTVNGVKASTTSNITGIYDMVGGSWERTMANYNNLGAISGFTSPNVTNLPSKYITRYVTLNLLNSSGMDYDNTIYGDAIYETSSGVARYNGSTWTGNANGAWYTDASNLPYTLVPWLNRGGGFNNSVAAGMYTFVLTSGPSSTHSFRPILIVI